MGLHWPKFYSINLKTPETEFSQEVTKTESKINSISCGEFSKMAEKIMGYRQDGVSMAEVFELNEKAGYKDLVKILNAMAKEAYSRTKWISQGNQENEILDFKTYGLKTLWQNYYSKEDDSLDFDFQINLIFNNIEISPEIMNEKEKIKKRTVKGWTYKLDSKGNIMKDSLGIDIKVDKVIDISVRTIEFRQSKAAKVVSEVQIINKKNNYIIDRFPLTSQFIFENIFMKYFGDIRALESRDRILIKKRFIPYPPDEVLVYDNSEMIKNKLKYIIINYNFSE